MTIQSLRMAKDVGVKTRTVRAMTPRTEWRSKLSCPSASFVVAVVVDVVLAPVLVHPTPVLHIASVATVAAVIFAAVTVAFAPFAVAFLDFQNSAVRRVSEAAKATARTRTMQMAGRRESSRRLPSSSLRRMRWKPGTVFSESGRATMTGRETELWRMPWYWKRKLRRKAAACPRVMLDS